MVEPGQILDKYELLEKVGQGGMAVVYRGLDRSLKRVVAVKVLHHHLSDHPEARARFEREAHAVAKLRHENILEIYDYSGTDSEESYIVTEFIEGQTLKQFTTSHTLGFAETGAMITAEVCRALAHAHSMGILHRDVKPENIMIRDDGAIKLMDFGIAQMVDGHRMTVTGQLLGSPAYMAPEHVEGGQLDMRTDVFSTGILLYQLVTGELPFQGRNPHEILKRIAECQYSDPSFHNPRVGKELAGIIRTAMARDKEHRFASITQMLHALEGFLAGSGLGDVREELARFFASPSSYEVALRERLISALTERGRNAVADNRAQALEYFNRVLTIDDGNKEVLAEVARMSRKTRGLRLALLAGAIIVLAGAGASARAWLRKAEVPVATAAIDAGTSEPRSAPVPTAPIAALPAVLAQDALDAGSPAKTPLVTPAESIVAPARTLGEPSRRRTPPPSTAPPSGRLPTAAPTIAPDAGPALAARRFSLYLSPRTAQFQIDSGPWRPWTGVTQLDLSPGTHVITAKDLNCCEAKTHVVSDSATAGRISMVLPFLPGAIVATCDRPDVQLLVAGKRRRLGTRVNIPITSAMGVETVQVDFVSPEGRETQELKVRFKERKTVSCAP
jgi:eukaryotic-like serine/threonine-protein kinase